jgi:26S proteasome regulatory subunit T2
MGGQQSRGDGAGGESEQEKRDKKAKKYEAPPPTRVGKKKKKKSGPPQTQRVPTVAPATKCKLRLLKLERVKDYLLMEEEFVLRQEQVKPQEETAQKERSKVEDIRGSPMNVASLEEVGRRWRHCTRASARLRLLFAHAPLRRALRADD